MIDNQRLPIAAALAAALLTLLPATGGASSTASTASDSASSATSSASDSLGTSSNSSSKATPVAGDYRIIDVAAADRPGHLRLTLQHADGRRQAPPVQLTLPRQALDDSGLGNGDLVSAQPRPYGVQFAAARTGRPFFLVLDDDWHREMRSVPVPL